MISRLLSLISMLRRLIISVSGSFVLDLGFLLIDLSESDYDRYFKEAHKVSLWLLN